MAHLTTKRIDPAYKIHETTEDDVRLIRAHTRTLFEAFVTHLNHEQRKMLVNPLACKFTQYETLKPTRLSVWAKMLPVYNRIDECHDHREVIGLMGLQ